MNRQSVVLELIQGQPSLDLSGQFEQAAVVGLQLRMGEKDQLELLFIQRAQRKDDPWSGQIGFPGGFREDGESLPAAIAREYQEELGKSLPLDTDLRRLHDIQARKASKFLDFFIRPYVFFHTQDDFTLQDKEVEAAFWVSINGLTAAANQTEIQLNERRTLPAIALPGGRILWGLSWLIFQDLFDRIKGELHA